MVEKTSDVSTLVDQEWLEQEFGEEADFIVKKVKEVSEKLKHAQNEIGKAVWGQDSIIELTINCMLAGGHLIQEGVPGIAKTRMVSSIAKVMGLESARVQFTPDLMPPDILGSEIQHENPDGTLEFKHVDGPVFTQFFMADEINRAGPKTQSALLEAMQERKVTVSGQTRRLRNPFTVMATQNPLEQEGTYPLPEAQLDRFMMKLNVQYPDEQAEQRVMVETTSTKESIKSLFERSEEKKEDLTEARFKGDETELEQILGPNDLVLFQKLAERLPLSQKVVDAATNIVRRARPQDENAPDIVKKYVDQGPGPRAVQAFAKAARAKALMRGDVTPNIQDIKDLMDPILNHRVILKYSAKGNDVSLDDVYEELTANL